MPKSKEELQMEYTQLCAQLGELELRKASAQDAIKGMNDSRNTITQKVRNLQKAFQALPEEQATPTPSPAPSDATTGQPEALNTPSSEVPSVQS